MHAAGHTVAATQAHAYLCCLRFRFRVELVLQSAFAVQGGVAGESPWCAFRVVCNPILPSASCQYGWVGAAGRAVLLSACLSPELRLSHDLHTSLSVVAFARGPEGYRGGTKVLPPRAFLLRERRMFFFLFEIGLVRMIVGFLIPIVHMILFSFFRGSRPLSCYCLYRTSVGHTGDPQGLLSELRGRRPISGLFTVR